MPTTLTLPNGSVITVPDGMSPAQMDSIVADAMSVKPATAAPAQRMLDDSNQFTAGVKGMLSPIVPVSRAAQEFANKIEGTNRPIVSPSQTELPKSAGEAANTAIDLGMSFSGLQPMYNLQTGLWNVAEPLVREPIATLRGGVAGVVEGLGNWSPADLLGVLIGTKVARKLTAKSSPGLRTVPGEAAPPPAVATLRKPTGEVKATVPMNPVGGGVKPGEAVGLSDLLQAVDEAKSGVKSPGSKAFSALLESELRNKDPKSGKLTTTKYEDSNATAPFEEPAVPETRGLVADVAEGPRRPGERMPTTARNAPDPGGEVVGLQGEMQDSFKQALRDAATRAAEKAVDAAGGGTKASKKLPPMPKLTPRARPARPEAPISDKVDIEAIVNETVEEVVNKVARAEPEVLAKRNPKLEALASEMEAQPLAPNRKVNEALLAESVRGASGRVEVPGQGAPKAEPPVISAPSGGEVQSVSGHKQASITRIVILLDQVDRTAERATLKGLISEEDLARVEAIVDETEKSISGDFVSKGQFDAAAAKLDKVLSELRLNRKEGGATPITLSELRGNGAAPDPAGPAPVPVLPPLPKGPKPSPAGAAVTPTPAPAANIGLPTSQATPLRTKATSAFPEPTKGPVTKVESATSKAVPAKKLNLENLSPTEQIRISFLERGLPAAVRVSIQETGKIPKVNTDMLDKAMEYSALYDKTKGAAPTALNAPVNEVAAPTVVKKTIREEKAAERVPQSVATPRVETLIRETGTAESPAPVAGKPKVKGIPASVRANIDDPAATPLFREVAEEVAKKWKDKDFDMGKFHAEVVEGIEARRVSRIKTVAKEIDDTASANIVAAAKAAGVPAPKVESTVARSEAIAQKVAMPSAKRVAPEAKVVDKIVDDILQRPINERGTLANKLREERAAARANKPAVQPPVGGKPAINKYVKDSDVDLPPPGVDRRLWRRMHALEIEAKKLKANGITDARLVNEMRRFWGSSEAGRRLGIPKTEVEALSGAPHKRLPFVEKLAQLDREANNRIKFLMRDPRGFLRLEALMMAGGAVTGGLTGAAIGGDSFEDRFATSVSMALMGGLAGYAAPIVATKKGRTAIGNRVMGKSKSIIEELDTANLLAGPAVIKASLGSLGGIAAAIWQRFQEGRKADAVRGMKFMVKEAGPLWMKTAFGPMKGRTQSTKMGSLTSNVQKQAGGLSTGILNQVLRPFVAADVTGTAAMKRMGFSEAESLRFMMNGEPTSWQGQAILQANNSVWIARMLSKFPRVRLNSIERGIEFTPFLSKRYAGGPARRGKSEFHTRSARGAEQITEAARKARAQYGGMAMVAGGLYGYFGDPSPQAAAVATSLAGPAFLPAAAAAAFGKGLKKTGILTGIRDAMIEAADSVPAVSNINIRSSVPTENKPLPDRFRLGRPLRRGLAAAGIIKDDE